MQDYLQDILGFTQNESKLYAAMIEGTPIEVSQLSENTGLPRSRVYEILNTLAAKGLLVKQGSGTNYTLIPPHEALTSIQQQIIDEHNEKIAAIDELSKYVHDVWKKEVADLSPGVEMLSLKVAEPLFINHIKHVKSRVWIAAASTEASIDMRQSGTALSRSANNNLDVRYLISDLDVGKRVAKAFSYFTPFNNLNYKIRHNSQVYTSFVILDSIIYIFFFGNEGTLQASTLRTSSTQLLLSFEWMFEQLWDDATDIQTDI